MRPKYLSIIVVVVTVVFVFGAADTVMAQDCYDYWASQCLTYNRPTPLMDYVPQERGIYDTSYRELQEADCRVCHATTGERHRLTGLPCEDCHDGNPAPTDPPPYTCETTGCHSWDDVATNGWHHLTDASGSGNCIACHDQTLIGPFSPGTSLIHDPPTVSLPTPYSCQNCHWQQQVVNQSGDPNNPGHPSTYDHYDAFGIFVGFYEYPDPIVHVSTSHMKEHTSNVTPTCGRCHSLTGTDPNNPGDPSWAHTNPELIRYCQRCHPKELLHNIHVQDNNAWEAVGFHMSGDPNGVPDTYRLFTANEMCDACHVPPIITQVSPNQQEPTIYRGYEAAYLSAALGYTITPPRWGRVRIYGNNFGTEQISGDQVRIGDPRAGAPIELQYDTDTDPFTVETVLGGVSLYIGPWNENDSNMIGVYLYPEPGQYLYALYGPNVGLHWLDTWLGLWVVKYNGGGPVASNVEPIKVITPLPD